MINNNNKQWKKTIRLWLHSQWRIGGGAATAQTFSEAQCAKVQEVVASNMPKNMGIGKLKAKTVELIGDTIVVDLSENFADLPFTQESVAKLKTDIKQAVGNTYDNCKVKVTIEGNDIDR